MNGLELGSTPAAMWTVVQGLLIATLLSALIGLQRQLARKPAGLRTHVLVAVGACVFSELTRVLGDSRSVIIGVVTGVGFLGAGAIVRQRYSPHGLTTAASIWSVAAIGVACGLTTRTALTIAVTATIITVVLLLVPDRGIVDRAPFMRWTIVSVSFDAAQLDLERLRVLLRQHCSQAVPTDAVLYERRDEGLIGTIGFALATRRSLAAVLGEIAALAAIVKVEVTDEAGGS